ncbi:MAG: multi-sensor signal transduction histidine kinase [Parcubacteria group bacterium Gr01-1014_3]|nr:MAG: multi-sensor signal transduction histidine kinase [Parcubacteria group bacterium Gr01-1014_3]
MAERFLNFIKVSRTRRFWAVFSLLILPIVLHATVAFAPPIFPELKVLNTSVGHLLLLALSVAIAALMVNILNQIVVAESKYKALLESVGDGLYAIDKEKNIVFMNETAQEMLGLKPGCIGKKFYEQWLNEDEKGNPVSTEKRPISIALSGRKISTMIYYVPLNKPRIPVALTVTPVVLYGKTVGAIGVFRDVTKEQAIDRAKSEFISIASHQLRTPLIGIRWVIERMIKQKDEFSEKQKTYLNDISFSAQRLTSMIELLLDVSRIESGAMKITPKPVELVEFMNNYIKEYRLLCLKKKVQITFKSNLKTLTAVTDINALRIILQNLTGNAIDYTPAGGKVDIRLEDREKRFLIVVQDAGIGIARADQKRVFEKFFRAGNALTFKTDGAGIGLYVTAEAVKLLGGKIWFESEENKGSTFYVELPK